MALVKQFNMYRKGDDTESFLKLYSREDIRIGRKGEGNINIKEPFVSVLIGFQPKALAEFFKGMEGTGFKVRFLYMPAIDRKSPESGLRRIRKRHI